MYELIRRDILTCAFAPGEQLREQDMAEQYATSRQPIRDALLRLEREHLVTVAPRQGYQVNPISLADAQDLFRFRLAIEPACATEAIERADDATLAELDRFRTLPEGTAFTDYNREFHSAIARASGNKRMSIVACDLIAQADRLVLVSLGTIKGRDPAVLVAEHGAILDLLQQRDVRATRKLLKAHISQAEKRVIAALSRSAIRS
ncbi:GntR family transcriptional regulator [Sphingomonas sp. CARO-RG-8B-R24-01]|uniref:GntR family transcriptional regulator n=1 Tax=Sphingomonas sp. CARO-RG-8B-R24-01 TaxID=2914831 RepID=UPI001F58E675